MKPFPAHTFSNQESFVELSGGTEAMRNCNSTQTSKLSSTTTSLSVTSPEPNLLDPYRDKHFTTSCRFTRLNAAET
jgi:hypothetical protein